jgi:diamine N-acetyltransferase
MSEAIELGPDAVVTLREITKETVRSIIDLQVAPEQEDFAAPNSVSIAQAHFDDKAWFRAIYADETPVGFVMLFDDPEKPFYYLWRYMIDAKYQGRGYGRLAINLLITHVKTRPGAKELLVTYVPGKGSPEKFYEKVGFVNTGVKHGDEWEMKLTFE